MEKQLFQDQSPLQRIELLKDNADSIEDVGYMKPFTDAEIEEFREELVTSTIDHNQLVLELKSIKENYKSRMAPLQKKVLDNALRIKEKSEYIKEACYKIINHNDREVGFYNSDGILVAQRPARADESQYTLRGMNIKAVNQ